jgi:hypothetical protein
MSEPSAGPERVEETSARGKLFDPWVLRTRLQIQKHRLEAAAASSSSSSPAAFEGIVNRRPVLKESRKRQHEGNYSTRGEGGKGARLTRQHPHEVLRTRLQIQKHRLEAAAASSSSSSPAAFEAGPERVEETSARGKLFDPWGGGKGGQTHETAP